MADINLLQPEARSSASVAGQLKQLLSRILLILLFVIVAGYAYLYFDIWRTNNAIAETKAAIDKAQSDAINNKSRSELLTRQGQLSELNTLLKDHMYWSHLLPELARIPLKSAQYTAIEAEASGKLTLTVALPSYQDLEKFMQIFDLPEYNQQFSNVKILAITKTQNEGFTGISVRVQLTFNPAFIKGRM